jgi:hypothetical protein
MLFDLYSTIGPFNGIRLIERVVKFKKVLLNVSRNKKVNCGNIDKNT